MNENWLPHLKDSVPNSVSADKLSMYTIALEGWRRGLPLKFYIVKYGSRREINYSFKYEGKEYKFAVSKGENVTKEAMRIAKDKSKTKEYLSKNNVSVPEGRKFNQSAKDDAILEYADIIGYPVVLKPANANLGIGVIPKIQHRKELSESLYQVREVLGYQEVILEKHIEGEENRIYVIDGKVIAAMKRVPANIVGDGKHTIRQLIRLKNRERRKNPNYKGRNIVIDLALRRNVESKGFTLDTVLEDGKKLYLRNNSNISSGGESIDVTDDLTKEMKDLAIAATKAIPGLTQSGVDVMINEKDNTGAIIEVNTRPGIGGHLYPSVGKARDIPKAIIDYYFPETKVSKNSSNFYFDYKSVIDVLNYGIADKVIVPPIPHSNSIIKSFTLHGELKSFAVKRWIQRQALSHNLNGYIEPTTNETANILLAGNEKNIDDFIVKLEKEKNLTSNVSINKSYPPIKTGFEIKKISTNMNTKKDTNQINRDSKSSKISLNYKQKMYNKFGDTIIWKVYKKLKRND